ncbi:hypothetical protein [Spirosoma sp. KNUC1025]|uniref:hypothetical protein n=1 Tax=Spirosoma sp. KNUC1025 TaxID=2894082 RepID=UPI00386FE345|nr:hypothetical protein LN737_17370 [Spirosoma sp. KNUC1025]
MSQEKLLTQLIKSLTDPEFDKLTKLYLNEVEGVVNIFNCNGPHDSGIDIRSEAISKIEIQYQITTKENRFEAKFWSDIAKAKNNVDNYDLPNKVRYFYSYPLANSTIFSLKREAKKQYNIIVDIVDANTIAGIATEYPNIRNEIYELSNLDKYRGGSDFFNDQKVKTFYDLMSFGTSNDIKYNIIKSFVLNYLYTNSNSSPLDLLRKINNHFTSSITESYFDTFCRKLRSERKIQYAVDREICLTENEKERIHSVLDNFAIEEALLKRGLIEVLDRYNLKEYVDEVIKHLIDLYESNYSINLGEFTKRNSTINDLRTATEHFNLFIKRITNDDNLENLTKQLLKVADENEILSRITAGQVYSKVSDPDRLQEYIIQHNNNKNIFLDTNVIINLICVYYDPNFELDDYHYKAAKEFLSFSTQNNLNLKTIKVYIEEASNIFKEAIEVIPFTKLPVFEALGGSNNIFYQHYIKLKSANALSDNKIDFESYLKQYGISTSLNVHEHILYSQVKYLLDSLFINIENVPLYDLSAAKSLIVSDLNENKRSKSSFAINNDAIMFNRLGEEDVLVNPIDPIFCTWDSSLLRVRRKYFEAFPSCTQWLMYTPTRLIDHYSMMKFKVKQGTLTSDVLWMLEEDYGFKERTQLLVDSISTIINPNNEVGLRYTNKFAELRQKVIIQTEYKEASPDVTSETNPLDFIFQKLLVNYLSDTNKDAFSLFKNLFTKGEYFDTVFNILENEIKFYSVYKNISSDLIPSIDSLLSKPDQIQNDTIEHNNTSDIQASSKQDTMNSK